jgi:hypothetical protein
MLAELHPARQAAGQEETGQDRVNRRFVHSNRLSACSDLLVTSGAPERRSETASMIALETLIFMHIQLAIVHKVSAFTSFNTTPPCEEREFENSHI